MKQKIRENINNKKNTLNKIIQKKRKSEINLKKRNSQKMLSPICEMSVSPNLVI